MAMLRSQAEPRPYFGGVGRLASYRWIINVRGYANIVSSTNPEDEVYGHVYDLTSSDEDRLDRNEGVPFCYTKEIIAIDFWESKDGEAVDVSCYGMKKNVLVYIDRERVVDDTPQKEYIHRMNMGITDAVHKAGVPFAYVQKVLRHFIPEHRQPAEEEELASKQAMNFQETR